MNRDVAYIANDEGSTTLDVPYFSLSLSVLLSHFDSRESNEKSSGRTRETAKNCKNVIRNPT